MKTIDIEFDKPRKLRYDVNSIDYIEQTIGKPFAKIDLDNLYMREIAALIAGGLMHESPDITPKDVLNIISEHSIDMEYVMGKVVEAVSLGFDKKK